MSIRKSNKIFSLLNNLLIDYPSPANISNFWNFGFLLGIFMVFQTLTGIFLSMHYIAHTSLAFDSVIMISREVNMGWIFRSFHTIGASFLFIMVYIHMVRGIYFQSYFLTMETWNSGLFLLLLMMLTAFLGYVLPWGQMSFWAATVITNMVSAVPYFGLSIVQWLWGGFAVDKATLTRFYSFHFLLPFIILALILFHLMFLHETGSNNPLNLNSSIYKFSFFPYFLIKDFFFLMLALFFFLATIFLFPSVFNEPENFLKANSLSTPTHIKPEWYFLWAYAILRAIPSKLGGVLAMVLAILVFFLFPAKVLLLKKFKNMKTIFYFWVSTLLVLTWIGGCPVEWPYDFLSKIFCFLYFSFTLILFMT